MVSYDTTQIALFVSLVLTVAAVGIVLVLGTFAGAVVRNRRTRLSRHESLRTYYGRLAFHH
jgi:ABC-type spermidine/putrescine transport system permease subunit II